MTKDMTRGTPRNLILQFTLPLIIGNLFQQFYSLADTIIVGRFIGVDALAAVGSTGSINYLILGFVSGMCVGFSIPVSQAFGAQRQDEMRRYVANSAWLCSIWAVGLTAVTVVFTRPILVLMMTPDNILDDAANYIGFIFAGIPFIFLYNMVASLMRSLGDSKTPLYFLLFTSGLNIGLDLLFILVFHLDVFGAALATVVSQGISGLLSLVVLLRKFKSIRPHAGEGRFSSAHCARLSSVGLPMGLQCSITAIGSVILQGAVNQLGSGVVASITAGSKEQGLLTIPLESLGTAMATYAGQNWGARRLDRVRRGVRDSVIMGAIYSVLAFLFFWVCGRWLMLLFVDAAETQIIADAGTFLFWNSLFYIPLSTLIVYRYALQGLGYSTLAMLAGVAEMLARTAVAFLLVAPLGLLGASLANPAAWVAACVFLIPAYRWVVGRLQNYMNVPKEPPAHPDTAK